MLKRGWKLEKLLISLWLLAINTPHQMVYGALEESDAKHHHQRNKLTNRHHQMHVWPHVGVLTTSLFLLSPLSLIKKSEGIKQRQIYQEQGEGGWRRAFFLFL